MRRFTLIAAALLMMSGSASAQKRFAHQPQRSGKTQQPAANMQVKKAPAKVRQATASLFMPLHEDVYFYEEEWMKTGENNYTYDTHGNVLTSDYVTEEGTIRTEYVYNENGLWTSKTETSLDEEGNQISANRQTRAYDNVVKDLVVESMEYIEEDGQWLLVDYGRTWKRNITRDEKGHITTISIETYYMGDFKETRRTTITYNEDGLADTWKHEELTYSGMNLEWEEFYTLKDMQWYTTDGQISAEDIDEFYTGNNRLKSARVEEPGFGEVGTITASYEENGNYAYSYNYADPVSRNVTTVTYTDGYGSVTEEMAYYEDMDEDGVASDEELLESYKSVVTCNERGETVSEEFFFDGEFDGGAKYDVSYGDYDYPTEWIMSEYDYDMDDYIPFIKLVRSNFVDVTAATSINAAPAIEADAAQGVYNLQGVKVAQSLDRLPAGLYIVKMNGQTRKVIKK